MSTCIALVVISTRKECGTPVPNDQQFCREHLIKDNRSRGLFRRGIPTRADPHGQTSKWVPRG